MVKKLKENSNVQIVLTTHNPHIANMGSYKYELKSKTLFER